MRRRPLRAALPAPAGTALALVLTATALTAATSGCGLGCPAELDVEPVVIHGKGKPRVDLRLEAQVTLDDDPAEGVVVEFSGVGPDGGIVLGNATSGGDGTARLEVTGGIGRDTVRGRDADRWTTYRARTSVLQPSDRAADAVCAEQVKASFRYEPD